MKLQVILASLVFAAASATTYAADAEQKQMQPHSHMQEKTGIAPPAAAASDKKADEAAAPAAKQEKKAKNKKQHLHPRDGK